jgi:spermidine synthase
VTAGPSGGRGPSWSLVALFFVSGATSLVYQTVWARGLHHVLGTSSFAVSVVLAAFMAGLGLGGALAARWGGRAPRPLRTYGQLELGIGAWALVFPWLLEAVTPLYLWLDVGPPALASTFHAALAAALLLPPTTAMGATLPLLARLVTDRRGTAGDRVGVLYASNTAGAVAGTAAAGLLLLPVIGLAATTAAAAAGNLALGFAAIALDGRFPPLVPRDDLEPVDPDDAPSTAPVRTWDLALVAGVAALANEVVWTRLVALLLGGTTYAFTAMLLAVLLGIAAGGRIGGILADDALRWRGTGAVLRGFAAIQLALCGLGVGLAFAWPQVPYVFVWLFDAFGGKDHPAAVFVASFGCAVLLLLLPATAMGAAFPFAVRGAMGDGEEVARPVGRVYAANTAGGVIGALLAGFVVLPALGLQAGIAAAAAINAIGAAAAWWRAERPTSAVVAVIAAGLALGIRAPWDPLWMSGGMYQYVSQFRDHSAAGILRFATKDQELLFYDEGRSSVVTVGRNADTGNIWLANNGKIDASTSGDLPTQVLVGVVGAQFVDAPRRALVVGLASGITAGAVTLLPEIEEIEVVELEPAGVEAAKLFAEHNHGVVGHERVRIVVNDGRNHLLRAAPGSYDLVVSEPSNPYLSGVANLFTREFWALGRTRLAPGGVWAQWLQLYGMGPDELRGLIRTFAEVYPHVAVYVAIEGADLVLLGADHPLVPDEAAAQRLLASEAVADELGQVGIRFPLDLVAYHAMDRDQALAFAGDAPVVTDDNLRVEYAAPLWLHTDVSIRNWDELLASAAVPWSVLSMQPLDLLDLAETYERLGDERRADLVRARALGWLDPRDALWGEIVEAIEGGGGDP